MLANRPPIPPKRKKVRNRGVIEIYRDNHPFCECCAMEGRMNTNYLEMHHISGGLHRTDELWNIISVCRDCHNRATHYNAVGKDSYQVNLMFLGLKMLKGELNIEAGAFYNEKYTFRAIETSANFLNHNGYFRSYNKIKPVII